MSQQDTPLADMLNRGVDEPELSPDAPETRHQDQVFNEDGPEAFSDAKEESGETEPNSQTSEPAKAKGFDPKEQQAKTEDADLKTDGGEHAPAEKPKEKLKPWQHARINAATERAQKAELRAQQLERLAEEQANWIRQAQQQMQPQADQHGQQPQQGPDPQALMDERDWKLKTDLGWQISSQKHGEDAAHQATHWAADRMKADPAFAQSIRIASNPVEFSIQEFKKAQLDQQLATHGYDLDALVKARMAEMQQTPIAQDPGTTPLSQPQQPRQSSLPQNMPNDFASAPSGAGRVTGASQGMTPLSVLLDPSNKG